MNTAINDLMVVHNLIYKGHVTAFFPLHNEFDMMGFNRLREGTRTDDQEARLDKKEALKKKNLTKIQEQFRDIMTHGYEYVKELRSDLREDWTMLRLTKNEDKPRRCRPFMIFMPPVDSIRAYFGEKIAYYFDFLGLYSRYLMASPLVGVALFFIFIIFSSSHDLTKTFYCIYAIVTILWTTIFLEHLKRRSNSKAIEWGQAELQEDEIIRPQFIGKSRRSPINDDLQEPWYPLFKRVFKFTVTFTVLAIMEIISLSITGTLQFISWYLGKNVWHNDAEIIWAPITMAIAQGFFILFLDAIFKPMIYALTKFENHKTKIRFENSYVLKIFLFRFINNYSSLFFIAFIKQYTIGCVGTRYQRISRNNTCMWELKYQVICIFLMYILQNVYEIAKPMFKACCTKKNYLLKVRQTNEYTDEYILKEKVETEFGKESYDEGEVNGTVEEYSELMVQFGFVALFSIAFPLIPLIAFINNIFEMLIDKNKVMNLTRRPVPSVAKSSGIFQQIFAVIAFLAIFTNLAIMSFTGLTFGEGNEYNSFLWFAIGALFFKFFLSETIPDYTESTLNVMQRHKVVVKKTLTTMAKDDNGQFKVERINLDVMFTQKKDGNPDDTQGALARDGATPKKGGSQEDEDSKIIEEELAKKE